MFARRRLGPTYRQWRRRLDNPEVKAARSLLGQLRAEPVQVVHFGASESLFVSAGDTDQRRLSQMIDDELGDVSYACLAGPGYPPRLFSAYLGLLTALPQRPVVVVGLCVRLGYSAWAEHPAYGYRDAAAAVRRIKPTRAVWRIRAAIALPSEQDMAAHDGSLFPTLAGNLAVGSYRVPLKDPAAAGLSDEDADRLLYAYHYGALLPPEDSWLTTVTELGRDLRENGFSAVVYHMPAPIERGVELYGDVFRDQIVAGQRAVDDAFRSGYGPIDILQSGSVLDSSHFIDPRDATEHLNERGRTVLAGLIVSSVRQRLGEVERRDSANGAPSEPGRGSRQGH